MYIKINNKKFPKSDLIKLIATNKLQAIVHIRNIVNISLKDAKEIIENLENNTDYYDNSVIKIAEKEFVDEEIIAMKQTTNSSNDREKRSSSHIIKNDNRNKKWIYVIGLIFIIILYVLMIK